MVYSSRRWLWSLLLLLTGVELVLCSQPHFRDCRGSIRHVHLAVGRDPSTAMTVSFASVSSLEDMIRGGVLLGTDPQRLDRVVAETDIPQFYEAPLPGRRGGNYSSPLQHHIMIEGLQPNTTYYYQCLVRESLEDFQSLQDIIAKDLNERDSELKADVVNEEMREEKNESKAGAGARRKRRQRRQRETGLGRRFLAPPSYDSTQCACPDPNKIRSFTTAPEPGTGENIKFAIIGDIGQFAHSEETLDHLRLNREGVNAIMLAGDVAYAQEDHRRWDTFFDFLDDYPLVEEIPMQITPGNHDIDKYTHGKEIFLGYENRFRMPFAHPARLGLYEGDDGDLNMDRPPYPLPYEFGNAYYSFVYGPAHFIVLSSYSAMGPESKQYQWFTRQLELVDREHTPWLLVMFHCPLYNTFRPHQKDMQILKGREFIEPLLVQHKANLIFNGHIHAYQRTKNVAMGNLTKTGPVHIVMGAGGRAAAAEFLNPEPEEWIEMRDATIYGYGLLELYNKTHAHWDWVHTGNSSDHNAVWRQNVSLPIGGVDSVFIENQYFMTE